MKQKFLYLFLTTLLCLTGGGELWADDYVLSNTDALCIKSGNSLKNVNYSQVSRQFGSNGPVIIYSSTLTSGFTVNNEVIKFNGNQTPIKDPAGKITITNAKSAISSVEIAFSSTVKDIPYTCNGEAGTIASGSTRQTFTVNNSSCDLQFTIPASEGSTNYFLVINSITIHTAGDDGDVTPIAVDASFANSTITCEPSSGTITNELTISSPSPLFEPTISYAISGDAVGTVNSSSGEVTMGESTGSATVTATITPPNTTYYAVTNKTYTLTSAINSFAGTYPYTWDFTTGWGVTAEQLSNSSYWGDYDSTNGIVVNQTNIADEFLWTGNSGNHPNLGKTYGIKFTSTREGGVAKRIRLCPGSYVQIQNGVSFKFSSLSKGQKITVETSESNGFNSVTNATLVDGNYVVSANGDVIFDVSGQSNDGVMKITRITISKPTLETFRLEGTNELTRTYDASNLKIGRSSTDNDKPFMIYLDPNVATALETKRISSDLLHVTVDDESVVTVSDVTFADYGSPATRQRGTFFLNAFKPGTTNLNLVFDGNDTYEPMTVSAAFTLNKADQSISYPNSSVSISYEESVNNTLTVTSNPTGNTVTYTSSDTHVATVAADGTVTVANSGTCVITASLSGNDFYNAASASYTLTVNGTQTPTIAWNATSELTESGGVWTAQDLPYGNQKFYTAYVSDADGSGVTSNAIRYGLVEGFEEYLTIDSKTGKIEPTRKFADESLTEKVVQVYAYIPGSGTRNPASRIIYNVKIVKGTFSGNLFKQTDLTVNAGCTIAPQNNLQSMRWEDIDAITVTLKTGSNSTAVPGTGESTVTDYKLATPKATYFDTKTATSGNDKGKEIVDWFYPIFKGLAEGTVTYTVAMSSKLYGDLSGDITLHVLDEETTTGFAWASATRKYTIYEGDYMFLPEISGSTNGNFSYSVGADNQSTHHKYVYTRRWNGSQYVTTYNNKNFHKGEGFPNFDLTSDAEGNTAVTSVDASGNNVALLFWNTGTGTENDRLLIYGNKAGTVYLKAFDPQITTRALDLIEIEVKSKTDINADFESLKSSMTFPYTWDFTTDYDWSTEIETGTGNWTLNGSNYDLGMSSNINYDYADEDKDGIVWGNVNNDPTTNSSELTDKLLVGKDDKVLRGFAGMKIRLGNNGTGSWYSKRDGIHILPYTNSNTPRLRVTTGTHTLILPTPTGENCPETFKVFVKAKALATGEGTLWVRKVGENVSGQNSYYNFKNASVGDDIIYSVDATKDTPLELDLDKVDIYWIAYSTEAKNFAKFDNTSYYATTYSYPKDLDMDKSLNDVNTTVQPYYASAFNSADAVTMTAVSKSSHLAANTGVLLKSDENPGSCYMIAKPQNSTSVPEATSYATNYLKPNAEAGKVYGRDEENNKTRFVLAYRYIWVKADGTTDGTYTPCSDWSFVRAASTGATISKNTAYLEVPGDIYVMMDVSNAARRAPEVDSENDSADGDENYPATKQLLNIVFEEEQPATPEDPATEEPEDEDGDSDKDKDRPRKPGDDGWPKPPFPPVIIITDIDNVKTDDADSAVWHSMEGVRISQPTKPGLYIRNGKKIVIK